MVVVGGQAERLTDGNVIDADGYELRVIHTPGHTREHVSYALEDGSGRIVGVFTGGVMLFDSTGRTYLLGDDHTHALTVDQYKSVRRLAAELPAEAEVYPTHGFGSFCSATAVARDSSTVGEQHQVNPALAQDEATFVNELLANLSAYPAYYAHMGVINRDGPARRPVGTRRGRSYGAAPCHRSGRVGGGPSQPDRLRRRPPQRFHRVRTVGFIRDISGWLYAWGAPLTLIGEDSAQIAAAKRELVRIGVDHVRGAASGAIDKLAGALPLRSYRVADFATLAAEIDRDTVTILDVRRDDEFQESHLPKAVNIPVHELSGRLNELPAGEVWVHCASGYRASVAASILDSHDRVTVLVDDEFTTAEKLGLTQ